MTGRLVLRVRTPAGLLVDRTVAAVAAEDRSGWFGIGPGREDLVALLPPGLLVYRDDEGEAFVAHAGGILGLRRGECRVMSSGAVASRRLDEIADRLRAQFDRRRAGAEEQRGALRDLAREALRRVVREASS